MKDLAVKGGSNNAGKGLRQCVHLQPRIGGAQGEEGERQGRLAPHQDAQHAAQAEQHRQQDVPAQRSSSGVRQRCRRVT